MGGRARWKENATVRCLDDQTVGAMTGWFTDEVPDKSLASPRWHHLQCRPSQIINAMIKTASFRPRSLVPDHLTPTKGLLGLTYGLLGLNGEQEGGAEAMDAHKAGAV